MTKPYHQIIADIRENYEYFQAEADKYKRLLQVATESEAASKNKSGNHSRHVDPVTNLGDNTFKGKRFPDIVLNALSDNVPKSTGELKALWEAVIGKKQESKNISARLGNELKSRNLLANYKRADWPMEVRNWWVLPDWLDGESLKPEYELALVEKIKKQSKKENELKFS